MLLRLVFIADCLITLVAIVVVLAIYLAGLLVTAEQLVICVVIYLALLAVVPTFLSAAYIEDSYQRRPEADRDPRWNICNCC